MFDKKALWEAVKLPLRLLVLSIVPFLAAYFAQLPYEGAAVVSGLLIFLDKYLHELWKIEKTDVKGIVPF